MTDEKTARGFERHRDLAKHIERMANTGQTGSMTEWSAFLFELNRALTLARKEGMERAAKVAEQ